MNVYLDNAATTRQDEYVTQLINRVMLEAYANPSSVHLMGQTALSYVEEAREICAKAINCLPDEIIFTSGGTESDNMAIVGYAWKNSDKGKHIIASSIEHHAVLEACWRLERTGFEVSYIEPNSEGIIELENIKAAIRDDTILISAMHVNNEIGSIQDIAAIGTIAKECGIAFHTDAVQSFTKIPINVKEMNIDMMSVSAHKFHGPKGIGFMYLRKGIQLEPLIVGGGQERGMRSGTINAPLIAGMAQAVKIELSSRKETEQKIIKLREILMQRLFDSLDGIKINGSIESRIADNLNLYISGIKTDELLYACDLNGLCISAGSACAAGTIQDSHVIKAIGRNKGGASARITLSKYTTAEEIEFAAETIIAAVNKLRSK